MRKFIDILCEALQRRDPRFQFHLSVEPNLVPLQPFSQQSRTISSAGRRGEAGGEGIYTTLNLGYWATQLAYENDEPEEYPRYCYLVWVNGADVPTSVDSAHQEVSDPSDVTVLALLGDIGGPEDDAIDAGRYEWLADKWVANHPEFSENSMPN